MWSDVNISHSLTSCIQTMSVSLSFYHTRLNKQTLNYVFTFIVKTFTKRKSLSILAKGIKIICETTRVPFDDFGSKDAFKYLLNILSIESLMFVMPE